MSDSTDGEIRRLKFDEAGRFDVSFQHVASDVTNDKIKEAARAYSENMQRVLSLLELPLNLVSLAARWKTIRDQQYAAYRGTTTSNPNVYTGLDEEQVKEARRQEKEAEERAKYPNDVDFGSDAMNEILQIVPRQIPETDTRKMLQGCEAVLSAMIIGTWTAFETMAGDLWEVAINECPKHLSQLKGSAGRIWQSILSDARSEGIRVDEPSQIGVSQGAFKRPDRLQKSGSRSYRRTYRRLVQPRSPYGYFASAQV